jgi:prepilin-type N-terminal cleavage/methylation domain-containing protein
MRKQKKQNSKKTAKNEYPVSRKGFSLLEVLVAVTVFGLVVAAAAGTFASMQQAWRKQKSAIGLVQNSRWALEFITNELRQGGTVTISGGFQRLQFRPFPGPPTAFVWYWRGNGGGLGTATIIYRGTGANIAAANGNRRELANFIVFPNPSGNNIFINAGGGLYTIELTLRPQPTQPAGRENRNYVLSTQARPRN